MQISDAASLNKYWPVLRVDTGNIEAYDLCQRVLFLEQKKWPRQKRAGKRDWPVSLLN